MPIVSILISYITFNKLNLNWGAVPSALAAQYVWCTVDIYSGKHKILHFPFFEERQAPYYFPCSYFGKHTDLYFIAMIVKYKTQPFTIILRSFRINIWILNTIPLQTCYKIFCGIPYSFQSQKQLDNNNASQQLCVSRPQQSRHKLSLAYQHSSRLYWCQYHQQLHGSSPWQWLAWCGIFHL